MKRFLIACSLISLLAGSRCYASEYSVDLTDDVVLVDNHGEDKIQPASLTKMMTLWLVFDAIDKKKLSLTDKIVVSTTASKQAPCKLGLKPGQTISVKDAILASIVLSANDAAQVLSEAVAGDEKVFLKMMNHQAEILGLFDTHFENVNGLPNKNNVTTAKDMTLMGIALYKMLNWYNWFNTKEFIYHGVKYHNHNHLIGVMGIDGIKTGFVEASGFNIVVSSLRNGHRIMATVLGNHTSAASRDMETLSLVDRSYLRIFP